MGCWGEFFCKVPESRCWGGLHFCPCGRRARTSQALSPGLPSQKPKEQQRSVLRPAVLQAPQPKALSQTGE